MTGVQTCALPIRSEEHTSELQSHDNLVCRLLLENKILLSLGRRLAQRDGSRRDGRVATRAWEAAEVAACAAASGLSRRFLRHIPFFFFKFAAAPTDPPLPLPLPSPN